MVDPPPHTEKQSLRRKLRRARQTHFAELPDAVRALVFSRPPANALAIITKGATIGFYCAAGPEAPTLGYAKWFHENGHALALPWFADRNAPMKFRKWHNPWDEDELVRGPFAMPQPAAASPELAPDVLFVPLIGFTASGERLGQGGGHYDRWLAEHPNVPAIGLAWDCQKVGAIPSEPHDRRLAMVVTPTRVWTVAE